MILLMQPRIWLAFWAVSAHWQLIPSLHSPVLPSPSLQGCSQSLHPPAFIDTRDCPDHLHLALLNFIRFTWAHFLSLSRSLWMASHPSGMSNALLSFVSSANLLRVHLIPLSMSLMKILNSQEVWEERLPVKTEAKKLLSTLASSTSVVTSLPVLLIVGVHFL